MKGGGVCVYTVCGVSDVHICIWGGGGGGADIEI